MSSPSLTISKSSGLDFESVSSLFEQIFYKDHTENVESKLISIFLFVILSTLIAPKVLTVEKFTLINQPNSRLEVPLATLCPSSWPISSDSCERL